MKVVVKSASVTRPADTTQYAAGDVIANGTPVTMQFTAIPSVVGGGAVLQSASLQSSAAQATKLDGELWLFSSDVVVDADNAAFTPTDTELGTLVGILSFPVANVKAGDATSGTGGNAVCVLTNQQLAVNSDTLYGVLIARNTYTPISAEIFTAKLHFVRDYSRNG